MWFFSNLAIRKATAGWLYSFHQRVQNTESPEIWEVNGCGAQQRGCRAAGAGARTTNAPLSRLQIHIDVHRCKGTNQPALLSAFKQPERGQNGDIFMNALYIPINQSG